MIWKVWFDSDECQNVIIMKCDSFDEAIKYARTIDERYDTAQVIPDAIEYKPKYYFCCEQGEQNNVEQ